MGATSRPVAGWTRNRGRVLVTRRRPASAAASACPRRRSRRLLRRQRPTPRAAWPRAPGTRATPPPESIGASVGVRQAASTPRRWRSRSRAAPRTRRTDRVSQVCEDDQRGDRPGDGELGYRGHLMDRVDRRESARQVTASRHGKHRSAHPGQEPEQCPHRGHGGTDPQKHAHPRHVGRLCRGQQRQRRAGDALCPDGDEQQEGEGGIQGDDQTQRTGDGARDGHGGCADLLAEGGDPRVAGEGEEEQPRRLQDPVCRRRAQSRDRGLPRPGEGHDDERRDEQADEGDREQHTGQPGGLGDAAGEHHAQCADDAEPHDLSRPRLAAEGIGSCGDRHGRAGGGLADDERPSGRESPALTEAFAPVDIGAARLRELRGQLRRRGRVGPRNPGRKRQPDEQP